METMHNMKSKHSRAKCNKLLLSIIKLPLISSVQEEGLLSQPNKEIPLNLHQGSFSSIPQGAK